VPVTVEFYEDKEPVETGGFRKAFKVTSNIQNLLEQHGLEQHGLVSAGSKINFNFI